jgi:hypothetical protein
MGHMRSEAGRPFSFHAAVASDARSEPDSRASCAWPGSGACLDTPTAEAALDQLLAWGLVEERGGDITPTPRWNANLQAAAEKLNQLAAKMGANPEGNPLVLAVTQALASMNLTEDDALFRIAAEMLVTLELSRMTPAKRAQLGFPEHLL